MMEIVRPKLWEWREYQLYLRDAVENHFLPHLEPRRAQPGKLSIDFQALSPGYTAKLYELVPGELKKEFASLLQATNTALFNKIGFDKDYCGRFREFNEAYYRTAAELVRCLTREKKDLRAMWFNGMLFGRFEEVVVGGYYYYVISQENGGKKDADNKK